MHIQPNDDNAAFAGKTSQGERVERLTATGQRRQATVLFADMASFTPTAERLGEERTFLLMRRILGAMSEAVRAHDGTVSELLGDGILAVFGAPIAQENAPVQACKAAAEIADRLLALEDGLDREFGVRPKARIGIHTGPIVLSGDSQVIGDTVNLAARLQVEARPGTAVLSETTNRLIAGFFETEFAGERAIKGKSDPQRLFEMGKPIGAGSRFDAATRRGLTPLVARQDELAALDNLWSQVKGSCQFAHIVGDAGIGKSRLMFEFRRTLQASDYVICHCSPDGQSTPFEPFINAIRTLFLIEERDSAERIEDKLRRGVAELDQHGGERLPYLLNLLGHSGQPALRDVEPEVIGVRTRNALTAIFRERCRQSPLTLFIEDLHWIDTASEDWLLRFAREEQTMPLFVVATFRPHYTPPWSRLKNARTIALQPLSSQTTVELLKKRIGAVEVPASLAKVAVDKTQGNPLFVEEITNYLVEKGQLSHHDGGIDYKPLAAGFSLPASLENLLLERFDRLEEGPRRVLEAASVIGPTFSEELVVDATGLNGAVSSHLLTLESKELVFRDPHSGSFRFKHTLVQDAIYNRLLTSARQELHEKVATSIEQRSSANLNEVVDSLANHYAQTPQDKKTVRYTGLAGAKALQVYSLDEAEQRFRRVIELSETNPGCADESLLIEVLTKLARVHYYKGEMFNIIALVEPYLPRAESFGDQRKYSRLLFEVGYASVFAARGAAGKPYLEKALAIGEEINDPESIAYASLGLMFYYLFWAPVGEHTLCSCGVLSERFKSITPQLTDVWVRVKYLNFRWAEETFFSRFADARQLCFDLFDFSKATNDPRPMGFGYWQMAVTDLYADRYPEALDNAHKAMQIALAPLDRLLARLAEGGAYALMGRTDDALTVLGDVRQKNEASGFIVGVMMGDIFYGASMSLAGELGRGVRWIHDSIARIEAWGNPHFPALGYLILGEIYLQMATSPEKPPMAVMLRNLGFVLTNVPFAASKSRRYLEEAIRRCRTIGMPGHLARALVALGSLNLARKRTDEARSCLTEALVIAESVKAENIAAKAKQALATLSVE
jgi:class 3 adenylate cyclase/tetratricopeptide (TPR) repeat protein